MLGEQSPLPTAPEPLLLSSPATVNTPATAEPVLNPSIDDTVLSPDTTLDSKPTISATSEPLQKGDLALSQPDPVQKSDSEPVQKGEPATKPTEPNPTMYEPVKPVKDTSRVESKPAPSLNQQFNHSLWLNLRSLLYDPVE